MQLYKAAGVLCAGAMLAFGLAGCGSNSEQTTEAPPVNPPAGTVPIDNNVMGNAPTDNAPTDNTVIATGGASAMVKLKPTLGSKISGTVTFTKEADGVLVVADLTGLTPGLHGFHVHEKGDCSAPDASSAGGHFNPTNMPHGAPDDAKRHVGDFGNVEADTTGKAHWERLDKVVSLSGPDSVIGRAVIVHQGKDDLKSQPSGDAGARGACGVIEATK